MVGLGSRAVEEIFLDTKMTGASSDLMGASSAALAYCAYFGMGNGLLVMPSSGNLSYPMPIARMAESLLQTLMTETKRLVTEKEYAVHAVAAALLEQGRAHRRGTGGGVRRPPTRPTPRLPRRSSGSSSRCRASSRSGVRSSTVRRPGRARAPMRPRPVAAARAAGCRSPATRRWIPGRSTRNGRPASTSGATGRRSEPEPPSERSSATGRCRRAGR